MSGSNGGFNGSRPKLTAAQVQDAVNRRGQSPPESWTSIARDLQVTVPAVIYRVKQATETSGVSGGEAVAVPAEWEACVDEELAALITVARHGGDVTEVRELLDALGLLPGREGAQPKANAPVSDPTTRIAS